MKRSWIVGIAVGILAAIYFNMRHELDEMGGRSSLFG